MFTWSTTKAASAVSAPPTARRGQNAASQKLGASEAGAVRLAPSVRAISSWSRLRVAGCSDSGTPAASRRFWR